MLEGLLHFGDGGVESKEDPLVIGGQAHGVDFTFHLPTLHLAEATGIPQFVAEVAPQLHVLFIKQHIQTQRRTAHGAKAEGIGPILFDQLQWIR